MVISKVDRYTLDPVCGAPVVGERRVGQAVMRTLVSMDCFVAKPEGEFFTFASGLQAEVKVVADPICEDPSARKYVTGIFAGNSCVRWAAGIGYVPEGARPLAVE